MTTVRAQCASCAASVVLQPVDVTLTAYGPARWYAFQCPACRAHVCKPADDEVVQLLAQAAVQPRVVVPAPRPTVEGRAPDGPPIDNGDVTSLIIDLHLVLDPIAELAP